MKTDLDRRLVQLERQVRREMDMRIIGFMLEYSRRAQAILNEEELETFIQHLGFMIANPHIELPEQAAEVFHKLEKDQGVEEIFNNLSSLVQTKVRAGQIASTPGHLLQVLLQKSGYGNDDDPSGADLQRYESAA